MNNVHLSILRKIIPFLLFQCIEKMSHANCPVCQEYLHTSPNPCHIPPCHHLVHKHCFEGLLSNGHYYCPTCSKSLLDLSPLWQIMQSQIEKSPMQGRYKVSSSVGSKPTFWRAEPSFLISELCRALAFLKRA